MSSIDEIGGEADVCWFCHQPNTDVFDSEFDTFLHIACLRQRLQDDPSDEEARIMEYLLVIP